MRCRGRTEPALFLLFGVRVCALRLAFMRVCARVSELCSTGVLRRAASRCGQACRAFDVRGGAVCEREVVPICARTLARTRACYHAVGPSVGMAWKRRCITNEVL